MKNAFFITSALSSLCFVSVVQPISLKEHEQWWTNNLSFKIDEFNNWLGDENAASRVCARAHIKKCGYTKLLDIPCGLCTEYVGYKSEAFEIEYLGIDITEALVTRAQGFGIPAVLASIEDIPFADSFFDVSYARHILEHLPSYEVPLKELIRVAKKEVMVVFFMVPHMEASFIDGQVIQGALVYHNRYNKPDLEDYVKRNPKVKSIDWEVVNENESILHIYLHNATV